MAKKPLTRAQFKEYGSQGGKKTLEKYGKAHFSKIAKKRHKKTKKRST